MRLYFDVNDYDKVYDAVANKLGLQSDCFETDDCICIDEGDLEKIKTLLPKVEFCIR
jgi:hypothetical protein